MIVAHLPIKTVSEINIHKHWADRETRSRKKAQKWAIRLWWRSVDAKIPPPWRVEFTRIAPRLLDDDNLTSAFKVIRDELADCMVPGLARGRADSDPRIVWAYTQEKGAPHSIRVQISRIEG